ncbi:MAG: hypothetical protein H6807_18010 [Planctomycetes bacterium]|nr:hypothetical protein [Planctomycetota bacterium]
MNPLPKRDLEPLARLALVLSFAYLVTLGCVLLQEAFRTLPDGSVEFVDQAAELQATKGYFFHVIAGLLGCVWYARRSRSKIPLAFAAIACGFCAAWTLIAFSAKTLGALGFIPALLCGFLFKWRMKYRILPD